MISIGRVVYYAHECCGEKITCSNHSKCDGNCMFFLNHLRTTKHYRATHGQQYEWLCETAGCKSKHSEPYKDGICPICKRKKAIWDSLEKHKDKTFLLIDNGVRQLSIYDLAEKAKYQRMSYVWKLKVGEDTYLYRCGKVRRIE